MSKPTIASLTATVETLTKAADKAEKRIATLTTDLTTSNERADQERAGRQTAEKALDVAQGEIASLTKSLKAYKGSATKARNEVTVLKRDRSPQARAIGSMKAARSEEEAAAGAAALEAAIANGPVELVFSDGKKEIREIEPLIAEGGAFRVTPRGRVLDFEPLLERVGIKLEVKVAGVGLLNEAGEQVGYCRLIEPVVVASQKVMIPRGSIRF